MPYETPIPRSWLQCRITATQAQKELSSSDWRQLHSTMQAGDEIWSFVSPFHYWENLAGRAGIVLIRDGQVIAEMVTFMS